MNSGAMKTNLRIVYLLLGLGLTSALGPALFPLSATGVRTISSVCVPPPANMVSWWPGDGNAQDIQGSNHGTLQGGVTFAAGEVGQAFSFNGSGSQYVTTPVFTPGSQATLDAWINPSSLTGGYTDMSLPGVTRRTAAGAVGNCRDWSVGLYGGKLGALYRPSGAVTNCQAGPGAAALLQSQINVQIGTWYHMALTLDGATARLYVNGVLQATGAADPNYTPDSHFQIGAAFCCSSDAFAGQVDEVEAFNRALSASEIQAIYNAGSAGKCRTCTPPPSQMVSWWPGDGNAQDIQGGNHGMLQNGATFAAGKVRQAFSFDGVDDQVVVPHSANQNTGSQITIDAWVNPSSSGHGRTILQKRSASNVGGYVFETTGHPFGNNNGLAWVIMIGGVYRSLQTPADVLTLNVWQHVAATYDGAAMRIYVNGVEKASLAQSGAIDAVTDPLVIGRNVVNTSSAWQGLIDEVALFNRALSQSEIQAIVNAGSAGKCLCLTINPPTLPAGLAGTSYNQTLTATGGVTPHTFSVSAGALPAGLSLSSSGVLSGTPTVFGTFDFTVRATAPNDCFGERAYTLMINPPCGTITVNPATLPNGFQGGAYSQMLTATGGTAPHAFAVTTGSLPGGLNLASGGALMGTPAAAGAFNFTITATDNNGCVGTRTYTVIISGTGLQFYPLPAPVRLLDTRPGASPNACSQPNAPITGQTARLQLGRNFCTIPANAQALTGNVTTVNSGGGFLTLYPSDAQQPTVASTNYGVNEIINNVFTVGLGANDGAFNIFALTTTDVVVDVTGYYASPNTGGLYFHPLPVPVRLLETRAGEPVGCFKPGTPLPGGVDTTQQVTGIACVGIPAAARAIVGNATTVGPQAGGYLTLFPADAVRPLVASSNYNVGQIVNGPFTVGLSPTGQFKLFTTATTDLVVDVLGYYSTEANDVNGTGLLFTPLARPVRLLETRATPPNLTGCFKPNAPLNGGQVYTQTARGTCDSLTIPATALAVVGNATVVFPLSTGYLTLWPSSAAQPTVATSNYNTNDVINRHFIVGLGNADGAFKLFSLAMTELVIDLSGYFAP